MQATESYIHARVIPLPRPGTLIGLMELYERNYMLLKGLFADHDPTTNSAADSGAQRAVHRFDARRRLESVVVQRERYTTDLLLSYSLHDRRGAAVHPVRLKIRVYRDARQAELLYSSAPFTKDESLRDKWLLNKFLNGLLLRFTRRGARLIRCDTSLPTTTGTIPGGDLNESENQPGGT